MPRKRERLRELEARFCALYVEKAQVEERAKALHDDLMRVQGALAETQALPDDPAEGQVGDD